MHRWETRFGSFCCRSSEIANGKKLPAADNPSQDLICDRQPHEPRRMPADRRPFCSALPLLLTVRGSHVFGQVARVYSRGKRRHGNGSKKAQIFV